MSIIIFLIVLAILVLVHEFGHFIVAKMSGIRVDEFGLGFPPKIFGKKFGSTLYTLNAIPFGGFVKIYGEDSHGEEIKPEDRATSFVYKPKYIQAAVLIAGVTFNIIFAWLILSLGFMIGFPSSVGEINSGKITNVKLLVTDVMAGSPSLLAGLEVGDEIRAVSGGTASVTAPQLTAEKVRSVIESSPEKVSITYKRGSLAEKTVDIVPSTELVPGKKIIGIGMDNIGMLKLPIHKALWEGAKTTWILARETTKGLAKFFWDIFSFQSDFSQVSGPIGIAGAVGDAKTLGFVYLLSLISLISINLAIINLLPFPALDGGRLLFVLIEAIIRRPISPVFVRRANVIGFSFLIILMVVVTAHDIFKLF